MYGVYGDVYGCMQVESTNKMRIAVANASASNTLYKRVDIMDRMKVSQSVSQ